MEENIRRRRWRWLGHTLRKPPRSSGRQALNWNPQGQRKRGRQRNTWRRELEMDIKRTGQTWKQLERIAQDIWDWRANVGGLCSGKSKGPKLSKLSFSDNQLQKVLDGFPKNVPTAGVRCSTEAEQTYSVNIPKTAQNASVHLVNRMCRQLPRAHIEQFTRPG